MLSISKLAIQLTTPLLLRKPCKHFASVARVCQRQLGFLVTAVVGLQQQPPALSSHTSVQRCRWESQYMVSYSIGGLLKPSLYRTWLLRCLGGAGDLVVVEYQSQIPSQTWQRERAQASTFFAVRCTQSYCYRKWSVRPSVRLSVCLSVRNGNVVVPWA